MSIESLYKDRSTKDPHKAEAGDIYAKILKVTKELSAQRKEQYIRLEGCPVSVAEQVFALVSLGKAKNPYLEPSEARPLQRGLPRRGRRRWRCAA